MFGFQIHRSFSPLNRWGVYRFRSWGNGTGVFEIVPGSRSWIGR